MLKLSINYNKSEKLYEKYKNIIKNKECYTNVFYLISKNQKNFIIGKWKVAYGFVHISDNIYCRHCFILETNDVIDPTVFTLKNRSENRNYFVSKIFNNIDEYLDAINDEKGLPSLLNFLKCEDEQAMKWAKENEYTFIL